MSGEGRDADVAELGHLDQQIATEQARAVSAHQALVAADAQLRNTIARRDSIALRLATTTVAPPAPTPDQAGTASASHTAASPEELIGMTRAAAPEASTRTVQNVLFILGGLLLGTAAIVFTAVAWTTFGVQGRATILGVVTLVALTAPVVALVRKLRATAETFAAIALLLVLLDGYAAWSVNLFNAQAMHGSRYAGLVCVAAAVVGLGYRALTKLVGPAFVALLAVQPALPLLLTPDPLSAAGWSLVWSGVATLNLIAGWLVGANAEPGERELPGAARAILQVMSLGLYGTWLAVAALVALAAEVLSATVAERAQAGASIVAVAAVFAASTRLRRSTLLARCAGAVAVIALAVAVGGVVAAAWPGHTILLSALVALASAVAALAAQRMLPDAGPAGSGRRCGSRVRRRRPRGRRHRHGLRRVDDRRHRSTVEAPRSR